MQLPALSCQGAPCAVSPVYVPWKACIPGSISIPSKPLHQCPCITGAVPHVYTAVLAPRPGSRVQMRALKAWLAALVRRAGIICA